MAFTSWCAFFPCVPGKHCMRRREEPLKVVKFVARSLCAIDRGTTPPIAAHRHRCNIKGLFTLSHRTQESMAR
jgi:hypothetical protein